MDAFETVPEQAEAKRLLRAALAEDAPAHAYLFHGPRGVGKRRAALGFAAELIAASPRGEPAGSPDAAAESAASDRGRVERGSHPDVYLVEPLGDQIRIDDIRELRRDLHMRPFEAARRVYLVYAAETMNEDAADALLKDLEEPPSYAVIVLVADDLGPLPETIRSRCQLVPFTRLSERAIRQELDARAPGLEPDQAASLARLAAGRLDRVQRLLDPASARRREALLEVARAVYAEPAFEPGDAAARILEGARERADESKEQAEQELELLDLTARESEQRVRRAARGAEREELLASLEELASWYRDLVVVAVGAERAVVHADRLDVLVADGTTERLAGAERAAELTRETWRAFEEFNLSPPLALEALFVKLRRELGANVPSLT
ncbi:MAG TPA: DNA polymerase III subunit [Gaiellaceae bacterium]|nr:DNA polymerase III subunit [Gaiellaceae bacterium]